MLSTSFSFAGDHKANIIVVTHGSDTDAFLKEENGVEAAKKDTGADVQYRNPPTGDLNEMASLIEAAIAQKPDGIVVSIPAPDILGGPIKAAVAADSSHIYEFWCWRFKKFRCCNACWATRI